MKIERKKLLAILKLVEPALSSARNQVEELSHIWFDGEYVSAFDDIIGIRAKFSTEFKGGVRGDKLIGILENTKVREVTIDEGDDGNLAMKAGRARITLALLPIDRWFWRPEIPDVDPYKITKEFLSAVGLTLISVGTDKILQPEERGLTVIQNGKSADVYSTDTVSLSWFSVPTPKSEDAIYSTADHERLIMPTPFCKQVLKVKVGAELRFDENAAYCTATSMIPESDGEVLLFSKLVEDEKKAKLAEVVTHCLNTEQSFEIPSRFAAALDRAVVLLEDHPVQVEIREGYLCLYAKTEFGEIDDAIKLDKAPELPDVTTLIDTDKLKRGLTDRTHMSVSKQCFVLRGPGDFVHIVSTK